MVWKVGGREVEGWEGVRRVRGRKEGNNTQGRWEGK